MINLKELRKSLQITQVEAARRFGVSANTWARWERGEISPGSKNFVSLAILSGLSRKRKNGKDNPKTKR